MAKYLIKMLVLLLLFWIVSSSLSLFADFGLTKCSNEPLINEWKQVISGNINSNIVVLGSSRAKKHFNPVIIESITGKSCYNLGIDGSKSAMQFAKWHTYQANNNFPNIIIYNIEPGTFGQDSILFNKEQYLPFYSVLPLKSYLKTIVNPLEYFLPVYKYHGYSNLFLDGMVNAFFQTSQRHTGKGFSGLPVVKDNLTALLTDDHYYLSEVNIQTGVFYLEQLVQECKSQNSKLVLVYSPEFHSHYNKCNNIAEFNTVIGKFVTRHQVAFIDYRDDSICFQENLFYDADHLNKTGADKFSAIFSNHLQAMIDDEK